MGKKALVISGGGSKGAFAVGVVKHLAENFPEIKFDIFVGTSTGSLIVPLVAADQIPLLEQLYTTIHTDDIVLKGNIVENFQFSISLFDANPVTKLIKEFYNDEVCNTILAGNKEVYINTTCLQTGEAVVWSNKNAPAGSEAHVVKIDSPKTFRRAVLASANQPVFM